MIWEVRDDGKVTVILRAKQSQLVKPPRVMLAEYVQNVAVDFQRVGIELLRDEYRIRQHRDSDLVEIFWSAQVPVGQVADAREYMMTLANSHAGG